MAEPSKTCQRDRSGSVPGRVHFPDNQVTPDHAGEIVLQFSPDRQHADAHLGFLQEGRKYEIILDVPRYLGEEVHVLKPNSHLHLQEIKTNPDKSGHQFVLELEAYHDKLINEELVLNVLPGQHQETFVLSVLARVLGRGKGTPMLKQGIKCIGVDALDSEMSDAGFPSRKHSSGITKIHSPH